MRYRRFEVTPKPDGSVTVVSHGPIVAVARLLVPVWLLMLLVALIMSLVSGNWAAVGVFLLLIGICMTNFGKLKRQGMRREEAEKEAFHAQDLQRLHDQREWAGTITNQSPMTPVSLADELAKLAALRGQGVLTDQEFDTIKRRLVSQQ